MLQFVGCDDDLRGRGEGLEDRGEDEGLDGVPGGGRDGVFSLGSVGFMYERQGRDHLGEALVAF